MSHISDAFSSTGATAIPVLALAMLAGAERLMKPGALDKAKHPKLVKALYSPYWYLVFTVSVFSVAAEYICMEVLRGTQPPSPHNAGILIEVTVVALLAIVLVPLPIGRIVSKPQVEEPKGPGKNSPQTEGRTGPEARGQDKDPM